MENANWTFHILTFGCKVNQYETQALREAWTARGGMECDDPTSADVLLLNTCAITANAVREARQTVRRLHRQCPAAHIVITGCAAQAAGPELAALAGVTHVAPQKDKASLLHGAGLFTFEEPLQKLPSSVFSGSVSSDPAFPGTLSSGPASSAPVPLSAPPSGAAPSVLILPHSSGQAHDSDLLFPPFSISGFRRSRPVLKVQDGCSHGCAYCIVPSTRGPARSRNPVEVLEEARRLLDAGFREIMLSGINLRQYAFPEQGCPDFWALLRFLERELAPQWAGQARLRISSLEPGQLDERGLQALADSRLVCPHLHISLQSGSPDVLKAMRRGHYTPQQLIQAVEQVASFWPRFGLGADILMGFPGETQAHVAETLELVSRLPFSYAHVFPFSARPGTIAARRDDQIPVIERQRRAEQVRGAVVVKRTLFMKALREEKRFFVALEGEDRQHGVNEYYVPCRLTSPAPSSSLRALIAVRPAGLMANGVAKGHTEADVQADLRSGVEASAQADTQTDAQTLLVVPEI